MELKTRKQAKISSFKGVDFSSSPLLVAENRAVSSANFIFENGVNRKRHGWIEKFRIGKGNINGIFECTLYGEKFIIVYAGKSFYKVTQNAETGDYEQINITNSSTNEECKVDANRLLDRRCQMFVNNNRLFFVGCGDYLTYSKYDNGFELRRVENDVLTYIPTTTINKGANTEKGDIEASHELPNLLSNKRKNTFVGNVIDSQFFVDAESIDTDVPIVMDHETLDENGNLIVKTYNNIGSSLYYNETVVGNIDFENGKITMTIDTKPPFDETESNLTVTFGCKVEDYADIVNNCEIGIAFGVDGNPDRLFVAGNENFPNIDFYSGWNDFTYFGDLNSTSVGSSDSKIIGYSRLGDGTLAIHKEEVNGEASIYYRTGVSNNSKEEDGSITVSAIFSIRGGTIGEGMASKYCNTTLAGDKLFLSKNGVYGIVLSSNIASTERFSRERSQYISEKLKQHSNLSEAVAIALDNKYYLAVDNVCYIADARMTSKNTSDINSFNYEWYYWENMPVRVWSVIDGKLFFGTEDGRVCTFDNEYTDRVFEYTSTGDLLIDYDINKVVFNTSLHITANDSIRFSNDVYVRKLSPDNILKVEEGRVFLGEDEIILFYNGTEVYADIVEGSGLEVNKKYFIDDVNLSNCSFRLVDEQKNPVEILNGGFRLSQNIKDVDLFVTNVGIDSFELSESKEANNILELVKYNNSQEYQTPIARFVIKSNVVALWYSPILDFGTNQATKTLLTLTISTEPTTNGQIDFGYTTKDTDISMEAQGVQVFDFSTLDFNNFTFDSSFANSYTVDLKDYFNFIQFFFKSDNEYACVIHSLTITYKINSTNKGVQ